MLDDVGRTVHVHAGDATPRRCATILLGPQRFTTTVGATVRSLDVDGPIAMINSGWEERETEDAELAGHLDGRGVNLRLHHRMMDVLDQGRALAPPRPGSSATGVDELRAFYGIRLQAAIDAVHAVAHRSSLHAIGPAAARVDAIEAVRDVDAVVRRRARRALPRGPGATAPGRERHASAGTAARSARCSTSARRVVIAGGNVRTLLHTLRVFDVRSAPELPVVAWSAGAMVLTDAGRPLPRPRAARRHGGRGLRPRARPGAGLLALPHAAAPAPRGPRADVVLARRFAGHGSSCSTTEHGVRFPDGATGLRARRPGPRPLACHVSVVAAA